MQHFFSFINGGNGFTFKFTCLSDRGCSKGIRLKDATSLSAWASSGLCLDKISKTSAVETAAQVSACSHL